MSNKAKHTEFVLIHTYEVYTAEFIHHDGVQTVHKSKTAGLQQWTLQSPAPHPTSLQIDQG